MNRCPHRDDGHCDVCKALVVLHTALLMIRDLGESEELQRRLAMRALNDGRVKKGIEALNKG